MPGVPGSGGPPPKRSDQRRRRNKPDHPIDRAASGESSKPPPANGRWHPVAKRWYQSLKRSGQSVFYEPSDWATAYLVAEAISRELSPQPLVVGRGEDATVEMVTLPPKGASLAAWLKAMTSLMVTEGDRRRLRLELLRGSLESEEASDVSWIDDARRRLRDSG